SLGFGGPIALAGYMQRDLVEQRRWISKRDYVDGLALAQLAPGPLAAQLAIYLGWIRGGLLGATWVALAFILPSFILVLLLFGPWWLEGVQGVASTDTLLRIGLYFAEAGSLVFGSGLAIVPFLHGGVVERFHWLTDRQFLDAVAVAMITPGPVVITVAFIGYLVAGLAGAILAAVGVFLPCLVIVLIAAPHYRRLVANAKVKAFVAGVTAGAIGAIGGAAV